MEDRRRYIALEVDMPDHPKVVALSDSTFRKHVRAKCYCHKNLTDGFLSEAAVRSLGVTAKELRELTTPWRDGEAPLWEKVVGGYRIHDYLKHQPSRAKMQRWSEAGRKGASVRWTEQTALPTASEPDSQPHANRMQDRNANVDVDVPPRRSPAENSSEAAPAAIRADAVVKAYVEGRRSAGLDPCDAKGRAILGQHARLALAAFWDERLVAREDYVPQAAALRWLTSAVDAARAAGRAGKNPAFLVDWLEAEQQRTLAGEKADRRQTVDRGLRPIGEVIDIRSLGGGTT